jgi:hypothetical protein
VTLHEALKEEVMPTVHMLYARQARGLEMVLVQLGANPCLVFMGVAQLPECFAQ